jgi:hypothetical protein
MSAGDIAVIGYWVKSPGTDFTKEWIVQEINSK